MVKIDLKVFRIQKRSTLSFFICLFACCLAAAQSEKPSCAPPLWTSEVLHNLAWARNRSSPELIDTSRAGVLFLDNNKLVVYEITANPGELSSRESAEISTPYRLRISMFNIARGELLASQDLPTRAHATSIHATTAGLLVWTGNKLRLYSTDFVELQQTTVGDSDRDSIDVVTTSPSGRTIVLNRIGQTFSRLQVLDGSTLKSKQSWTESTPLRRLYTISDTGISAADFNQEHILFTNFGTRKWTVVAGQSELKCVGFPTLMTNNTLANSCNPLSYLSTTGALIFRDTFQKKVVRAEDSYRSTWSGYGCLDQSKKGQRLLGYRKWAPSHREICSGL